MAYNKSRKTAPSPQTQEEAERIAKATQRPGQTKEHTRLIAQGIQKGIEEYKKQHKARARAADKAKKQQLRQQQSNDHDDDVEQEPVPAPSTSTRLPWLLLALSWAGFALYWWWQQPR